MNEFCSKIAALRGGFLISLTLFFSCVQILSFGINVYDYQRLVEVTCIFLFLFFVREVAWPAGLIGWSAICFFVAGFFSFVFSDRPFWGAVEWLRVGLLFAFSLVIANLENKYFRPLLVGVCFVAAALCVKVSVGFFVIVRTGEGIEVLADGFSNHRHFAECLIALCSLLSFWLFRFHKDWIAVYPLFICWLVLLLGGARASLLAFLMGFLMFFFLAGGGRKRLFVFVVSGFFAWILCAFIVDLSLVRVGAEMLRDGSSGRSVLWCNSLSFWSENVFLGIGPMHYAFYSREIAAHPHNLLFQVLSEWGAIAFGAGGSFLVGVVIKLFRVRADWGESFFVASPVLAGLLISSMFGGVLVVPIVELIFFLLLGVVLRSVDLGRSFIFSGALCRVFMICFVLLTAVAWLWRDLDVPRGAVSDAPRFWQNGGIPLD